MILRNYHTHTLFCDGKDSAEDMVLAAIEKGFSVLGFSGHSPLLNESWCMENTRKYRKEIARLKKKYKDKIEILCGIEQDYYSKPEKGFDYVIGSVHCVKATDGKLIAVDDTAQILINGINDYFGGDANAFAEEYFRTVSQVVAKTGAQIIGHFDLIQKFCEKEQIFDSTHPRYLNAAKATIKELIPTKALFEVNTGAMARGMRTSPYPEKDLLEFICKEGGDIIINSDCHNKEHLDCGFEASIKLVKECGFTRVGYITSKGICFENI